MSKKRKWYILETELHSHYYKDKGIFQPFTNECLIDNFEDAKKIGTMLRNKGHQIKVMPFYIEECDSNDFGTLGAYFERDVAVKKIEELQQQLAEKDNEIEELKNKITELIDCDYPRAMCRSGLRHEICEEIKKSFEYEILKQEKFYGVDGIKLHFAYIGNLLCEFDWKKILDKIEKGE